MMIKPVNKLYCDEKTFIPCRACGNYILLVP